MKINLIRVKFSNLFSFKDTQEIFFTAETKYTNKSENYIYKEGTYTVPILPAIAFYGANASGKSNVLNILTIFGSMLDRTNQKFSTNYYTPYLLNDYNPNLNSNLELELIVNSVRYILRLEFNKAGIMYENLSIFNNDKEEIIYTREKDKIKEYNRNRLKSKYDAFLTSDSIENENKIHRFILNEVITKDVINNIEITNKDEKEKELIQDTMIKYLISNFDSLFIEETISKRMDLMVLDVLNIRGVKDIEDLYEALKSLSKESLNNSSFINEELLAEVLNKDKKLAKKIVSLIKFADLGISNVEVKEKSSVLYSLKKSVLKNLIKKNAIKNPEETQDKKSYSIYCEHKGCEQKKHILSFSSQESEGTKQFLNYLIAFLPAFINGGVFIVDELEEKMHPFMLSKLVEMFNYKKINKAGAQLIFTTHNTSLLKTGKLERDEVWFVEKDNEGNSSVFPLSEFNDIRENFNYEKGYLEGRFGAIPYLEDIEELAKLLDDGE